MLRSHSLRLAVIAIALPVVSQFPPTCVGGSSAVLATACAQAVSTQTSTVSDPVGDPIFNNAPAFQDIILGQITKTASGDFELLMELAGSVPIAPPMPPTGANQIWWAWAFDLDPTTLPAGYPYGKNAERRPEFLVVVCWDGTAFTGTAIDRRPLLAGGEAVLTPVSFSINGTSVEAVLGYEQIGDVPPSFNWTPTTVDWAGPVGSSSNFFVDLAETVFNP